MRIAVVVAEFNGEVTGRMLDVARERADSLGMQVVHVCRVPGTFDMPAAVDALLRNDAVEGVATLGAVIKGQTKHDEVIAHATARSLQDLSMRHAKPVSMGVTGPGMQARQAYARIRPVAERAVEAVAKMAAELDGIRKISGGGEP